MNMPQEALTSRQISTIVLGLIFIWTVVLLVLPVWNYYQSHRAPLVVAQQSAFYLIWGNVGIWTIGMLGLYVGRKRLQKHMVEHVHLEIKLNDSEERYRILADNTTDVIWSMDFDGRHTYLSPSIEKLRGYTPAEVMQQSMEEIHTPESFAIISQTMAKAILNIQAGLPVETFREELEARCKDGSTVWTEVTASASYNPNGEFMEFIGVTRDITSRKQMEDALRKSESRFRSFVENANDIIFMMDTNRVFTYISPNWETMIGRNHTSFIGKTFEPLVHPDDIPACHAFLKRIITRFN